MLPRVLHGTYSCAEALLTEEQKRISADYYTTRSGKSCPVTDPRLDKTKGQDVRKLDSTVLGRERDYILPVRFYTNVRPKSPSCNTMCRPPATRFFNQIGSLPLRHKTRNRVQFDGSSFQQLFRWRGLNFLGNALLLVRRFLRDREPPSPATPSISFAPESSSAYAGS